MNSMNTEQSETIEDRPVFSVSLGKPQWKDRDLSPIVLAKGFMDIESDPIYSHRTLRDETAQRL